MSPSLYCPFCGEIVPILVRLVGDGVDKKYIIVTDFTSVDSPIPFIKVGVELDLEGIAGEIDRICAARKAKEKGE